MMTQSAFRSARARWLFWLAASLAFSEALLYARHLRSHNQTFHFLQWNLFLALLPFGASLVLRAIAESSPTPHPHATRAAGDGADGIDRGPSRDAEGPRTRSRRATRTASVLLFCCWFAFWPNAPYLMTDLVHLAARRDVPQWFDLLLLVSFANNGLLLAMGSLFDIERTITAHRPAARWARYAILSITIAAGAFAIFLGRFHRWNSWDLALRPLSVLDDCLAILTHPAAHKSAWTFTAAVAAFLVVAYGQFRARSLIALDRQGTKLAETSLSSAPA